MHYPPRTATNERLFGDLALSKRYVSKEQLYDALTYQKQAEALGRIAPHLGAILVDRGAMSPEQVSEILNSQMRE
jgi:hypothetical protein